MIIKRINALILVLIRKYYNYNSWHDSFFSDRPYAQKIVAHLNKRQKRDALLEVGCGTGDMLRRLTFKKKYGFDYEMQALKGLRFLSLFYNAGGKIKLMKFNFNKDKIYKSYDAIILVNWIHEIDPEILKQQIEKIFYRNLNSGGEIIIDTLRNQNYKHNHSIDSLTKNLKWK